jgi:hypothetical protein
MKTFMKTAFILVFVLFLNMFTEGQQANYYVLPVNGNGYSFWGNSNISKISMANTNDYHLGTITDYSIKTTIKSDPGCGWTWGKLNQAPVAGLSNDGNFWLSGLLGIGGYGYSDTRLFIHAVNQKAIQIYHEVENNYSHTILIFENNDLTKALTVVDKNQQDVYNLYGNGNVYMRDLVAQSVTVRPDPWGFPVPDFVFDKNYKIMPLGSLEEYIVNNKHLPDIPSGNELKEKGYDMKKMDYLLLQKIEELTLYIIELKKENDILQQQLKNN